VFGKVDDMVQFVGAMQSSIPSTAKVRFALDTDAHAFACEYNKVTPVTTPALGNGAAAAMSAAGGSVPQILRQRPVAQSTMDDASPAKRHRPASGHPAPAQDQGQHTVL
jgi:hypothetical protein